MTLPREIVNELRGTCQTLEEVLYLRVAEDLEDNLKFLDYLDSRIFKCTACSWWCDIEEESSEDFGLNDWTCLDCCEEGKPE